MAELDTSGGGKHKGGKVRSKKASTRVDLTAMVDLAFLLITFFILTTTLQKPKSMDLVMPDKEDKTKTDPIADNRSLTLLLGDNNKLEWYTGQFLKPIEGPTVTGYGKNQLRKVLEEEGKKIQATSGKGMFVVIKPSSQSVYNNLVAVMDELNIMNNQYRAIVEITPIEIELLKRENLYK
jgi:biopolymer transport protein ExbD